MKNLFCVIGAIISSAVLISLCFVLFVMCAYGLRWYVEHYITAVTIGMLAIMMTGFVLLPPSIFMVYVIAHALYHKCKKYWNEN